MPTDVLIVDDHEMFREGIRAAVEADPEFRVVGEAASADEAFETLESLEAKASPIVILDIHMPGGSGIELARSIRKRWSEIKILVLSGLDYPQYVQALFRIGIRGYVLKDETQSELVKALHAIVAGGVVIPPSLAELVVGPGKSPNPTGTELTVREMEVLEQLQHGLSDAEIAGRLEISPRTVGSHVANIRGRLGADSRTQAVALARERGLLR